MMESIKCALILSLAFGGTTSAVSPETGTVFPDSADFLFDKADLSWSIFREGTHCDRHVVNIAVTADLAGDCNTLVDASRNLIKPFAISPSKSHVSFSSFGTTVNNWFTGDSFIGQDPTLVYATMERAKQNCPADHSHKRVLKNAIAEAISRVNGEHKPEMFGSSFLYDRYKDMENLWSWVRGTNFASRDDTEVSRWVIVAVDKPPQMYGLPDEETYKLVQEQIINERHSHITLLVEGEEPIEQEWYDLVGCRTPIQKKHCKYIYKRKKDFLPQFVENMNRWTCAWDMPRLIDDPAPKKPGFVERENPNLRRGGRPD